VAALDYADIQGTILRGYRVDHARHFVLRVVDAAAARNTLGSLVDGSPGVPQVTTAARWTVKPEVFLNLGLTAAGLAAVGVDQGSLNTFPAAFLRGATSPATAQLVGDVGTSDPSAWVGGLSDGGAVHVVLSLWSLGDRAVIDEVSGVLRTTFAGALEELSALDADALSDNKVHFGYTDNISQPHVEGAPPTKRPRPDQQPVSPAGQFLLGHVNQYGATYSVSPTALSTATAALPPSASSTRTSPASSPFCRPTRRASASTPRRWRPRFAGAGGPACRWCSPLTRATRPRPCRRSGSTTTTT
jgi:hypothetical protein